MWRERYLLFFFVMKIEFSAKIRFSCVLFSNPSRVVFRYFRTALRKFELLRE